MRLEPSRVGFTGTRKGMTAEQIDRVREWLATLSNDMCGLEFHHGGCIGADFEAHRIAKFSPQGARIIVHPPTDTSLYADTGPDRVTTFLTPKPYLERDRDIVDSVDLLVAAPDSKMYRRGSGTWYTIRYATAQGKPVRIVYPDGGYVTETTWTI